MAYVAAADFRSATLKWYTAGLALSRAEASDALIDDCAKRAKELIDRYTGDTFEASEEETLTLDGEGTSILRVPKRIRAISSVSILQGTGDWAEIDADDYSVHASLNEDGDERISDIDYIAVAFGRTLDPHVFPHPLGLGHLSDGTLEMMFGTAWPNGFQNIEVVGDFGWTAAPEGIKRAAALIVYDLLKPRNNDVLRRAERFETDDAAFTMSRSEPTGIPEVDAILVEYAYPRVL